MNRRTFLTTLTVGGGAAFLGGAFWAHQAIARSQVHQELLDASQPILNSYLQRQMSELPARSREEMKRHFHQLCLRAHEFSDAICSPRFPEQLAELANQQEREKHLVTLFKAHVTTPHEVLERVHQVAEKISQDVDRDWTACCAELARQWNLTVKEEDRRLDAAALAASMTPLVSESIHQAAENARKKGKQLALDGGVLGQLGKEALLLMELVEEKTHWFRWPKFTKQVLQPLFAEFIDKARVFAALQESVTGNLSRLSELIGDRFEREVQLRLGDLHRWQRAAVDQAARQQARRLVRVL
jgi:hypothetical protein